MKDYFANTNWCLMMYNIIQHQIKTSEVETSDLQDEFLMNFQEYLARAIRADYRGGWESQLKVLADEIQKEIDDESFSVFESMEDKEIK